MKFHFLFIPFFSFSKWKLNYEPLKWFKRKTREKNFHLSSTLSSAILESMMEKERIVRTGCCNHYDASADFMLVIPVKWFIDCQCDEMNYFIFKIYVIFITNSTSSSSPMPISFIHSAQHKCKIVIICSILFYNKKKSLRKRLSASREEREDFHYYR